jgi:hypothetical protein
MANPSHLCCHQAPGYSTSVDLCYTVSSWVLQPPWAPSFYVLQSINQVFQFNQSPLLIPLLWLANFQVLRSCHIVDMILMCYLLLRTDNIWLVTTSACLMMSAMLTRENRRNILYQRTRSLWDCIPSCWGCWKTMPYPMIVPFGRLELFPIVN